MVLGLFKQRKKTMLRKGCREEGKEGGNLFLGSDRTRGTQ